MWCQSNLPSHWSHKFKLCLAFVISVPSIYQRVLAHLGWGPEDAHSDPLCHCARLKKKIPWKMQPSQQSVSSVLADAQPNVVFWHGGIPSFLNPSCWTRIKIRWQLDWASWKVVCFANFLYYNATAALCMGGIAWKREVRMEPDRGSEGTRWSQWGRNN